MALALLMLCAATGCRSSEGGVRHENYDLGYVNPPGAASMEPLDGIRCDDVVPPIVTRRVEPRYPADVRRQRVRGVVSVSLIIGTDGTPSDIQARSSPSATLSGLALEAVSQWGFIPAYCKDLERPIRVFMHLNMQFRLDSA